MTDDDPPELPDPTTAEAPRPAPPWAPVVEASASPQVLVGPGAEPPPGFAGESSSWDEEEETAQSSPSTDKDPVEDALAELAPGQDADTYDDAEDFEVSPVPIDEPMVEPAPAAAELVAEGTTDTPPGPDEALAPASPDLDASVAAAPEPTADEAAPSDGSAEVAGPVTPADPPDLPEQFESDAQRDGEGLVPDALVGEEEDEDTGLTWDAVAVALAAEPPIPAGLRPEAAPAPATAIGGTDTDDVPMADADRADVDTAEEEPDSDDWPAPPVGGSEPAVDSPEPVAVAVGAASVHEEMDEVAEFWNPTRTVEADDDFGPDWSEPDSSEPDSSEPDSSEPDSSGPDSSGPDAVGPEAWSAHDGDRATVRDLADDWAADTRIPAAAGGPADTDGPVDTWRSDGRRRRGVGRLTGPIAGRWSTMRPGERVNVVLYALTGVSIVAMGLELLAGPDSLPTDVSTTPAPVVSATTMRPNTTVTFTIPKPREEEPAPEPAPTPAAPAPVVPPRVTATPAPAPDPEPGPEPTTPTVQTTAPPATSPPTTRTTPTTSTGFPEPTPPVLPTFPGPPANQTQPTVTQQ